MRRLLVLGMVAFLVMAISGCGGEDRRTTIVVDILSSGGTRDGDITFDSVLGTYSPFFSSTPPNTIRVGEDPVVAGIASRGFITFPIDSIPADAVIRGATILLPILRVELLSPPSVSILIDMISFPPLDTLVTQPQLESVYNAPEILLGPSIEVFPGNAGTDVDFDATDAVIRARKLGFSNLQIRVIGSFGQIIIDDLDPPAGLTPLLTVEYR
jgi:hypothetical protein